MATSVPSTLSAFLVPYAKHFRSLGWRVEAICNGAKSVEELSEHFDAVHEIPWTRSPLDSANFLKAPKVIRDVVREREFDIVHLHDPIAAFVGRLALRGLRSSGSLKVVYTAHGFHFFRGAPIKNWALFWPAEALASIWTDRLIVINKEDHEATKRFPIPEKHVVYMPGIGVDTERYAARSVTKEDIRLVRTELGLDDTDQIMLMVAEFNPGKRHMDAVEALALSNRPHLNLVFAGVGPTLDSVSKRAHELGVGNRVHFLGYRNDVPALLAAAIGLMLPSEREGLPRAIMEALSLERPVIGTKIRGITELVDDSSGILVEVGDVRSMASALQRLLDNPYQALAMGKAGREAMRHFDIKHLLKLHEDLYSELIKAQIRQVH